ncbi:hypothetical protein SD81_016500 [Tolypothrix campylonemoides VB511288]|nr:hypothetical protein SD81_016500 [Tolypothrix campylonemoides VB511288]
MIRIASIAVATALVPCALDAAAQAPPREPVIDQKSRGDGVIGEKNRVDGVIGEKSRGDGIIGEKRPSTQRPGERGLAPLAIDRLPPVLRQPRASPTVTFPPPALRLQALPPSLRASLGAALSADALDAPRRFDLARMHAGDDRLVLANVASIGGHSHAEMAAGTGDGGGIVTLVFRTRPGERYLVDCAVVRAREAVFAASGPGNVDGIRVPVQSNVASFVTGPAAGAGMAYVEMRATAADATWEFQRCELTPIRP